MSRALVTWQSALGPSDSLWAPPISAARPRFHRSEAGTG